MLETQINTQESGKCKVCDKVQLHLVQLVNSRFATMTICHVCLEKMNDALKEHMDDVYFVLQREYNREYED